MTKFLIPLTAFVSLAAPAQAENISFARMNELTEQTEVACPAAIRRSNGENTSQALLNMVYTRTIEEKYFVLNLCKFFVQGKIEGLKAHESR